MACAIPFAELAPGASVRFTTIDGKYYMSIRDLIMVVCEKSAKAASQTWTRDITQEQIEELSEFTSSKQFPGNS